MDTEGTWSVQLSSDQTNGFDIGVYREEQDGSGNTTYEKLEGRVFSDQWQISALNASATITGSFYIPVPLPEDPEVYTVFQTDFDGLAGSDFRAMANQQGGTDVPSWSIPDGLASPASQLRLYLSLSLIHI